MEEVSRRDFIKSAALGVSGLGTLFIPNTSFSQSSSNGAWSIRNEWNYEEFLHYSKWVENIFDFKRGGGVKQKQARLGTILEDDEMNLLNNSDFLGNGNSKIPSSFMTGLTHCGSFPHLLFAYYSFRRALPAAISQITMESGGDIRYSYGNHPIGHVKSTDFSSFQSFISTGMERGKFNFVSGNYRTAPNLEGTDSVPISLNRKSLMPGSFCYNANGHMLVVGKVSDSGEVGFLDAHPNHSITSNQSLSAIPAVKSAEQGVTGMKKCYDGFRNPRLMRISGNTIVPFTNSEMVEFGFSVEQYKQMAEIKFKGAISINGQSANTYPQLVKASLRASGNKESPLEFLVNSSNEFASMLAERQDFVQKAWNYVLSNGPISFPNDLTLENIYQANGAWETWSSPSSDVDRKNKYLYILTNLDNMISSFRRTEVYDYSGCNSQAELVSALEIKKHELFSNLSVTYTSSTGRNFTLPLNEIENRLFALSFDPNHPPELRWGAPEGSEERKGMKLLSTPLRSGGSLNALEAYRLEQGLRYYPVRQDTPTSLDANKNPTSPPFGTIDEMLMKYK